MLHCHIAGLQMLGSGKLEEARDMCTQQMEEAHVKISSDADYRAGAWTAVAGRWD